MPDLHFASVQMHVRSIQQAKSASKATGELGSSSAQAVLAACDHELYRRYACMSRRRVQEAHCVHSEELSIVGTTVLREHSSCTNSGDKLHVRKTFHGRRHTRSRVFSAKLCRMLQHEDCVTSKMYPCFWLLLSLYEMCLCSDLSDQYPFGDRCFRYVRFVTDIISLRLCALVVS